MPAGGSVTRVTGGPKPNWGLLPAFGTGRAARVRAQWAQPAAPSLASSAARDAGRNA